MKHITMICAFGLALGSIQSGKAQVMGNFERAALKDLREISITVSVEGESACNPSVDEVRRDIINRLVPAGLKIIETGSNNNISISLASVQLSSFGICAGNHWLSVTYSTTVFTDNPPAFHPRWVSVFERSGVATSGTGRFSGQIRNILNGSVDAFLADWRLVNAGADFVRQAPPAVSPQTPPSAQPSGPNIRTVQARLQSLGHYQGTIDGISGPGTRTAIQTFQRSVSLPATGDLDTETMRRLFP